MTRSDRSAKQAYWHEVLEQHRQSGMSVKAFCEERGIPQPSFYQWRQRLQARAAQAAMPALVPVKLTEARAASTGHAVQIFTPRGYSIRIDVATPRDALVTILRAIESAGAGDDAC